MKILHLDAYEDRFLNYCSEFYTAREKKWDWFDPNLPYSVVNRYKRYPHWSFLVDNNEDLIAFSCVQTHFFPSNCARVLTRTYYHPSHRRGHLAYETNTKTPAMYMLEDQMKYVKNLNIDHLFFSVEYLRRKSSITNLAKKLHGKYNDEWKVLDDLYQTYPQDDDKRSWQVVCVLSRTSDTFPLKNLTIDEWKKMYG